MTADEIVARQEQISQIRQTIEASLQETQVQEEAMARLSQEKEEKSRQHKSFFAEREKLSDERSRH